MVCHSGAERITIDGSQITARLSCYATQKTGYIKLVNPPPFAPPNTNNIIEQDHPHVKRRIRSTFGFKSEAVAVLQNSIVTEHGLPLNAIAG
ncbi:hypothetical protein IL59_0213475 [Brucella suis bv. 4 str. 40]|nr:hypothetical protein IL59_0213475 [Brucella suis bv. 4 str. 40]